ncbi:MAG: hypothetical protein ACLR3S_09215 [Clostridium fessum]
MKRSMETTCIQGGWQPKNGEPRILPIYQSTTFKYSTSEQMGRLFDLEENGYFIPVWQTRPMMQSQIRSVSWRAARQQC